MSAKRKTILGIGIIVLALTAVGLVTAAQQRPAAASFQAVLVALQAEGTAFVVEFHAPVAGSTTWAVPDDASGRALSAVGGDYACFSEPWNAGTRERCIPFTNIAGISYLAGQ